MDDQLLEMPQDWQRGLAIVAHPDDLEYGAAAAIAKWTQQGREIAYLLITRGEAGIDGVPPQESAPLREAEQRASAALVGAGPVEFLDYQDGLITESLELRRDLARAIRRHRPELVITLNHHDYWGFGGWNTPDHRAAGRAALDAVGDAGNRWIFPELTTEGHEPWPGVRYVAIAGSPRTSHAVEVSDTIEPAIASLAAHHSYISALSDKPPEQYAREFIAMVTGWPAERFGGRPAVQFELLTR
jgi:LmbE family N-acetylglucosaminyl deacetylase